MDTGLLAVKFKAMFVHSAVTLITALVTALLVYLVWYPGKLAFITQGVTLYLMVLGVEVLLGPLMSLVIFNPAKPRAELIRDYSLVGFVQLAALCYGLYSVALSRPVFLVFVKDRIEVVAAVELDRLDLQQGSEGFNDLSWLGPKLICTESPTDPLEKSDLLTSALSGKDIQLLPKYYRECHSGEIIGRAFDKPALARMTEIQLEQLPETLRDTEFHWLPVVSHFGVWTAFYSSDDVSKPIYLELNPFEKTAGI